MELLFPDTTFFRILYGFIYLSVLALMVVSLWKIYVKMGVAGWKGIAPIYNIWVMVKQLKRPTGWFWILLLGAVAFSVFYFFMLLHLMNPGYAIVPAVVWLLGGLSLASLIVVFVYGIRLCLALMRSFDYAPLFLIVYFLLPVLFYVILAFGERPFTPPAPRLETRPAPPQDGPIVLEEEFFPQEELVPAEEAPRAEGSTAEPKEETAQASKSEA